AAVRPGPPGGGGRQSAKSNTATAAMSGSAAGRKMMSKRRSSSLDASRRNFLKGATLAAGATFAAPVAANAQATAPRANLKALPPGPRQVAVETQPPVKDPVTQSSSGGDFMVDVMKSLDIEY